MLVVYVIVTTSGTSHTALRHTPTAPIATARVKFRIGPWNAQTVTAPIAAKTPTIRWLIRHSARNIAGSQRCWRVRSAIANVPKKKKTNAIASVNENSPASVLARFPPMIRWLNAIACAASLVPGFPVKNRNDVTATANAAGVGFGARRPRAKT